MSTTLLNPENTALVLVDVQVKLERVMHNREELIGNIQRLIKGAQALGMPVIHTEQYPEGLGETVSGISEMLSEMKPVSKLSFSCCGEPKFMESFKALGKKQVLLAGIEAHVCVYQTAVDLLDAGYDVQVVADAVDSRTAENRSLALERMKEAGAVITSTEMALFEMVRGASSAHFKDISRIVK